MKVTIIKTDNFDQVSIEMPNDNTRFKLLDMMRGFTLQRMYWRSIIDCTFIEYFEPKVSDVFLFCADFIGDADEMLYIIEQFKQQRHYLRYLESCYYTPLTDKEIKNYATCLFPMIEH